MKKQLLFAALIAAGTFGASQINSGAVGIEAPKVEQPGTSRAIVCTGGKCLDLCPFGQPCVIEPAVGEESPSAFVCLPDDEGCGLRTCEFNATGACVIPVPVAPPEELIP